MRRDERGYMRIFKVIKKTEPGHLSMSKQQLLRREMESVRVKGSRAKTGAGKNNADVVNAIPLSDKLAGVYLGLLKQHACN